MAKIKCRFCEAPVDEKAVICINCGTNLKTGKSLILNNPKKRRLFKLLMLILFLAFVIAGGFHFFRLYKQNSTTALLPKEDKFAGTTAPDSNRDLSGFKNITTFPVNVKKSKNADDYHISIRQGLKKIWKKQYSKEDENKFTVYMNIRVSPNKHDNGQLRLKIYQGDASSSQYSLVYDRIAEIKEHNDIPILKKIPDSYKKLPPNVQKRILSHYKRNYDRQMRIYQMRKKSTFQAAKFSYSANSIIIPKNNIYFRILLCYPDGRIIKEHAPYKLQVPQSYSNNVNRINNNYQVKHDINEDAIYPSLFFGKPILYFDFHQRQAFKIKAMWIDGVNYPVPYLSECTSLTQRDKKSGKPVSIFRNILRFDYPFGGNVTLKLKIKNKSGIFKTVYYKFYLPFPPPALRKRFLPEQNKIFIYWENNAKYLNPQNFSRLPELVLSQSNNEIKTFKSFKAGKYEVNNVSPGEPVSYTLSLKNGEINSKKWTSKKGIQDCKLAFRSLESEMSKIVFVVPDENKKHSIRLEMVKTSLVFENSGIPAMKLLNKIINRAAQEKSIVTYDTDARDYVIGEKLFAMSGELRQKFVLKEADFAFQIRDYSCADGDGIELWLFKRELQGSQGSIKTNTKPWRLARFKLGEKELELDRIADLLIKTIKEKTDFYVAPDERIKQISPRSFICTNLRPLNQQRLIWDYKAISESFNLMLGENSRNVKFLSKEDWDLVIDERLRGDFEGYDIINNNDREVMLTGRMWRNGKQKSFFLKACDAFSGEILATKIFTGKTSEIAKAASKWCNTFKVADDIKVDFQYSLLMNNSSIQHRTPWRVNKDFLLRYGIIVESPERPIVRRTTRRDFSPLIFAKRQWKDGFRNKAVKVLEDEWKRKKGFDVALTLLSYYQTLKLKAKGSDLCNKLIYMENCPEAVLNYHTDFKNMKLSALSEAPRSAPKKKAMQPTLELLGDNTWINSKFDEMFYLDRDKICPQWNADGKYRTILLATKFNTRNISKCPLSPEAISNGMFYQLKTFGFYAGKVYSRYNPTTKKYEAEKPKYQKGQHVIVFLAGWNSLNPYSEKLPDELTYSRTANLYPRMFASGIVDKLYMVSKIRAILELKENLNMPMLNYSNYLREPHFKNAYGYFKRLLGNAMKANKDKDDITLAQYLAIDTLAKTHDQDALDLYYKIIEAPVPASHEEFLKLKHPFRNGDFIIYKAYTGNRKAQQYMSENSVYLRGYGDAEREKFDILFPLLKKMKSDTLIKVALKNGNVRSLYALRWAPKATFNNILIKYANLLPRPVAEYLIMGAGLDNAAWRWLKGHDLMQYFGKPEKELYAELREKHFQRVAKLKTNKESK